VTTSISLFGVRACLAMGPNRPPFPHAFTRGESGERRSVALDDELDCVREAVLAQRAKGNERVQICLCPPVFRPSSTEPQAPDPAFRALLEGAQVQMERTIARNGRQPLMRPSGGFWGASHA
jgi:hypothetical protein